MRHNHIYIYAIIMESTINIHFIKQYYVISGEWGEKK